MRHEARGLCVCQNDGEHSRCSIERISKKFDSLIDHAK
jgi:hypothetical protein